MAVLAPFSSWVWRGRRRAVRLLRLPRRAAPGRLAPGFVVVVIAVGRVKNLAERKADVAVLLEGLRQRHHIRVQVAEMRGEIKHTQGRRAQAGEQRRPRGIAQGLLAVGAVEAQSLGGQPVDVRRLDQRMTIAAQFRPQIVHRQEENIVGRSPPRG